VLAVVVVLGATAQEHFAEAIIMFKDLTVVLEHLEKI
jgi:hypothetical protein